LEPSQTSPYVTYTFNLYRYFLEDMQAASRDAAEEKRRKQEEAKAKKEAEALENRRRQEEGRARKDAAAAEKRRQQEVAKAQKASAALDKRRKQEEAKAQANKQVREVQAPAQAPRPSISIFGLGQEPNAEPKSVPQRAATTAKAPRGVPMIIKWRQRNDGTSNP
jgi:hypothetical protein